MHTWIAIALIGSAATATTSETPNWQTDYFKARSWAGEVKKPLAVIVGTGKEGWAKLINETGFDAKVNQTLARNYVCVYVDRSTATGKSLASAFEVNASTGLILSDRTGQVQAYHHSGDLKPGDLVSVLEKYSDPDRVVRTTESAAGPPAAPSSYQPGSQIVIPYRSFGGT